jgi:hypothetical protein
MLPNIIRFRTLPVEDLLKRSTEKIEFIISKSTSADKLVANVKSVYGLREDDIIQFRLFAAIVDISDIVDECKAYMKTGDEPYFSVLEENGQWVTEAEVSLILHT